VAATHEDTPDREIILVASVRIRPMMGLDTLESLPSPRIPYALVDPFILVDESVVPISPERASLDTKHPHRGFDNLSYLIADAARTGLSIGPDGVMKRARLRAGSLLDVPVRHEGDAIVRAVVGQGSPLELGTPGLILDVELLIDGTFSRQLSSDFNSFIYVLEGEAGLGSNQLWQFARRFLFSDPVARSLSMRGPGREPKASVGRPLDRDPQRPSSHAEQRPTPELNVLAAGRRPSAPRCAGRPREHLAGGRPESALHLQRPRSSAGWSGL
jgi:hypothetical protein